MTDIAFNWFLFLICFSLNMQDFKQIHRITILILKKYEGVDWQMKNIRRIGMIVLALLMLLTTIVPIFAAAGFTDVAADYWGKSHIDKAAEKGIVSGSLENGKSVFKPEDPVTKAEALIMVYKTLKTTNKLKSTENYTNKYKSVLESYNIPNWSFEAIAYTLEHNILSGSELAGLMSGTKQTNATREQVAMYLGRAIDSNVQTSSVTPLTFIDREVISTPALPYVQLLVGKKIISGDNNNRFNPKNTIKRVEMATVCAKAYDVLKTVDIVVEIPEPQEPKTTTKFRTIDFVAIETNTVLVRDDNDKQEIYQVLSNTEIIVNKLKRSISYLSRNQKANFVFDQDDRLIKIEVNPTENKYEGFIDKITLGTSYDSIMVYDEYGLPNDRRRTFKVYENDNILIELDNKRVDVKDLKEGDQISVIYDNDRATRITSYSKIQDITGILDDSVNFARYPFKISVRGVNNVVKDYEVEESVTVRLGSKRANLEDLVRGDIVTITLDRDRVTRIEAAQTNIKKTDKGIIQSITLGNPNSLTLIGKDDEEVRYEISNSASIYIDDERSTVRDLGVGYDVELELQGNVIVEIEAKKVEQRNSIEGEIVRFHDSINRIIVKGYDSSTRRYEEVPVFVNKDTKIIDKDGKTIDMRYLDRRDEVFVTGRYEDDVFVATRIIVIE